MTNSNLRMCRVYVIYSKGQYMYSITIHSIMFIEEPCNVYINVTLNVHGVISLCAKVLESYFNSFYTSFERL